MAGPAEDVVEKWPWLKQRNMTHHTLYNRPGKEAREEDVVVRGVWKGLEKGEKTGSAGCVNLQKSNRGEALNDEGDKKGNLVSLGFRVTFFRINYSSLLFFKQYNFFSTVVEYWRCS
ncbi:TPA: hypothetical protein HA338_07480 [Methanosarcina acetivorans]|uniref:Uncharacterized protein n=2 Tax=Methanosarcina acetivorans TaxID=2214 RepID=Q8TLR7_METAC|nr:hypothetical protein [Methanosarcina acetivorans]AAM06337.1 predicted protein [Methanosarcina acetivorans C2A]HIH93878.1 hypothetical protein [Methanosarcina acetivorans]